MVGIVFVSHSAKIAEGVRELANQMVQSKVPLAIAGGIDDPENPIGTDAMKVYEAIESVYSVDGVIVLMDLGSALLSAEMALEFLDPAQRENVVLSPAPFVEGAIAVVVRASVGGTREQVLEEAQGALAMKLDQLQDAPGETEKSSVSGATLSAGEQEVISLTFNNRLGLYARPAAQFVTIANHYLSDIQVAKGSKTANGKSINQMAVLGVRQGDEIQISAKGPDAEWARLETAISVALQEINTLQAQVRRQIGANEAAIFQAHALFLQDPVLIETIKNRVFSDQINVEAAWDQEISGMARQSP